MKSFDYFLIAGFGWSGSSAVVDLLKEYEGVWDPDIEFRIIKDPYGLDNLRHIITKTHNIGCIDNAIRDFLRFSEGCNRVPKRFALYMGEQRFAERLGPAYMEATHHFLEKIVTHRYAAYPWYFMHFKRDRLDVLEYKIRRHLGLKDKYKTVEMYYSNISDAEYMRCAQAYLDEIFAEVAAKNNAEHILLDNAVNYNLFKSQMQYFRNAKLVFVDRDPRDIYATMLQGEFSVGLEYAKKRDANLYIHLNEDKYPAIEAAKQSPNVLFVKFSDLILHYEDTVAWIEDFLGLDPAKHVRPKQFFDPAVSRKNLGLWKTVLTKEECRVFEEKMSAYLDPDFD